MFKQITTEIIRQLSPEIFIEKSVAVHNNRLLVGDRSYELNRNVTIYGFGKASLAMYRPLQRKLGDNITKSFLSIPYSSSYETQGNISTKVVKAARNNLPDGKTVSITRDIVKNANTLREKDLCICLISGGGSALLCDPIIPLQDLIATINAMVSRSATIQQLNRVRTYLCDVKGGGLASYIHPATTLSLIVSDVIGDPLQSIASGPTYPNTVSAEDVISTLRSINLTPEELPVSVRGLLETHFNSYPMMARSSDIFNHIIASNSLALAEASSAVQAHGYTPYIISSSLAGEAREVGREMVEVMQNANGGRGCQYLTQDQTSAIRRAVDAGGTNKKCLIFGGETTVTLRGSGKGGRCMELGLAAAKHIGELGLSITMVVTSTDGQDGPTDASGVIVTGTTSPEARSQGLQIQEFLDQNNSYEFFSRLNGGDNLLKSGMTGTNLMDIVLVFMEQ